MKKIKEDIEGLNKKSEDIDQAIKIIRDEIEEIDENNFNMQKEKEDKEKVKSEIDAAKAKEEEKYIHVEMKNEENDAEKAVEKTAGTLQFDGYLYKSILYETLKQKIAEIS